MDKIDLSSGASFFKTPEIAAEKAIESIKNREIFYGPTEGLPELRQAIADFYLKTHQVHLSKDQILITSGTKNALFNLFTNLITDTQNEVLVPAPAWFGFNEILRYCKGKFVPIPTAFDQQFKLSPDLVESYITSKTKVFVLTNPGNPTGKIYTKSELDSLFKMLEKYPDIYIIVDEIYEQVVFENNKVITAFESDFNQDRIIVVNGFSKSFAMSGWRIGYMAGPISVIKKCLDFQQATISGVSPLLQQAALAVINQVENVNKTMQPVLIHNRELITNELQAIPELKFLKPEGSYYAFVDFSAYLNSTTPSGVELKDGTAIWHYLYQDAGLILQPGELFGAPGFARITFAVETEKLTMALERLQTALKALTHSKIPA